MASHGAHGPTPTTSTSTERFSSLFWRRRHPTAVYCAVFWSFGMCVAFLGPTLLELGCKTGASLSTMAWVFFAQTLFILLGSATGGLLAQRFTSNVVLLSATVMLAATLAVIPFCYRVALLASVLAVMGYFMGIIDTVANVCMISLYTKDVSPFLQALHFFYGLGAFVSPIIAEPFLNVNCSTEIMRRPPSHSFHMNPKPKAPRPMLSTLSPQTTTLEPLTFTRTYDNDSTSSTSSSSYEQTTPVTRTTGDSNIDFLFWIMAFLQVPVILAVASLLAKQVYKNVTNSDSVTTIRQREEYEIMDKEVWKTRPNPGLDDSKLSDDSTFTYEEVSTAVRVLKPHSSELNGLHSDVGGDSIGEGEGGNVDHPLASNSQALLMTLLTAFLLFLYDGLQAAYGGYVYSYARKSFSISPTSAAYMNACFWGMFAFGRLLSIPIATRLSPDFMLFCNIAGCSFSMLLVLVFRRDHVVFYVGTSLFGIFLSSIYPTAISLAEQYINVTSSLASCIIVGAASGEMILPIIVGHEFEKAGPLSLVVTGLVITLLSFLVYLAVWVVGNSILRRTATPGMLGMLTSFLHKPGPDEDSGLVTHHVKYYSRMRSDISESSLGGELNDGLAEPQTISSQHQQ